MRRVRLILSAVLLIAVTTAPLMAQGGANLKRLDAEALKGWQTIRTNALSHDGQWFAYIVAPNEGNAEVVVRPTGEGEERR
ncbi:MAG: hypothetical protein ABR551_14320, partial [Gemmatimonadales bacterium]